jgi:KinB signaling pathway activation protein
LRKKGKVKQKMPLKNMMFWFFSTLVLGLMASFVLGNGLELISGEKVFKNGTELALTGLTFASVSLLGFFAYLIFNWLGLGLFRLPQLFQGVQIVLTLIVLGNLLYLQMKQFSGSPIWISLVVPFEIVIVAVFVAWLKAKWTNPSAWIPTFFFMVCATVLEAVSAINPKGTTIPFLLVFYTVFTLQICNAWQILQLHRWLRKNKKAKQSA